MRLVVVCEKLLPIRVEAKLIIDWVELLAERGHDVTLLTGYNGFEITPKGLRLQCFNRLDRLFEWRLGKFLRWQHQLIQEIKPDAVVSFSSITPGDIVVPLNGLHAFRVASIPFRLRHFLTRFRTRIFDLMRFKRDRVTLEKLCLSEEVPRYWLAITDAIDLEIADVMSSPTAKRVGLDLPLMPTVQLDKTSTREQLMKAYQIKEGKTIFVYPFNSLNNAPSFRLMLQAFQRFIQQGGEAVLLIAGFTRYADLETIGQLGLREHVRMLGPTEEHRKLFNCADLILAVADDDPAGWWARSTLPLGRPIVVTERCGVADLVRAHGGAVLPHPLEPDRLAEVMQEHVLRPIAPQPVDLSRNAVNPPQKTPSEYLAEHLENLLSSP